jgi:hypothetical protein
MQVQSSTLALGLLILTKFLSKVPLLGSKCIRPEGAFIYRDDQDFIMQELREQPAHIESLLTIGRVSILELALIGEFVMEGEPSSQYLRDCSNTRRLLSRHNSCNIGPQLV